MAESGFAGYIFCVRYILLRLLGLSIVWLAHLVVPEFHTQRERKLAGSTHHSLSSPAVAHSSKFHHFLIFSRLLPFLFVERKHFAVETSTTTTKFLAILSNLFNSIQQVQEME